MKEAINKHTIRHSLNSTKEKTTVLRYSTSLNVIFRRNMTRTVLIKRITQDFSGLMSKTTRLSVSNHLVIIPLL